MLIAWTTLIKLYVFAHTLSRLLNSEGVLMAYAGYAEREAKTTAALVCRRCHTDTSVLG